jgi:S1-C subfamily serine protease
MKYLIITVLIVAGVFAFVYANLTFRVHVGPLGMEAQSQVPTEPISAIAPLSQNQVIDEVNAVNFGLKIGDGKQSGLCSATLVDAQKFYLLTAWHCIELNHDKNGTPVKPYKYATGGLAGQLDITDDGKTLATHMYKFKVIASDEDRDLALIQLTDSADGKWPQGPAAKLACTNPRRLDNIYAVGQPYGSWGFIEKGSVSKVSLTNDLHVVYYSATTGPGMSGGAILNSRGRIIAVIDQQVADNRTIGIGSGLQNIMSFIAHIDGVSLSCAD